MTDFATPDDVLERTYRRAIEQADALGVTFRDLLPMLEPGTAAELRDYYLRTYA